MIRRSIGLALSRSAIAVWMSIAQRTASWAEANSASMPSPVVFTMRPPRLAISGSISSRRCLFWRSSTPSSSCSMSRL